MKTSELKLLHSHVVIGNYIEPDKVFGMDNGDSNSLLELKDDTFKSVKRTPVYFGPDKTKLFGWLHCTDTCQQLDTCTIICPPLGVEYMSTYRSMRYVADYFALAGMPAFRFDYHGTGDSSGVNDESNRLDAWLWSIEQACQQAKLLTGCSKAGLLGFRMGATLAALVSQKLELDFLVFWAGLESGRRFIRETRAIQMTGISQTNGTAAEYVEAGGIVYWPQTVNAIEEINLTKITPKASRVLIIPRDDLKTNTKLKSAWAENGIAVEQLELPGSSSMLLEALEAIVPFKSIAEIVQWIKNNPQMDNMHKKSQIIKEADAEVSAIFSTKSEFNIKESIVRYGESKDYFAILSEPDGVVDSSLPIILMTNSGATHRVGVSRLYVTLARDLASLGFRCLRIDIPGLGDSIIYDRQRENRDYITYSSDVLEQALASFGPNYRENKYIITGLCSGAYFSFHAALDLDEINIVESLLINPLTFYWHENMELEDSPIKNFGDWNWYKQAIKDPKSWKKLIGGGADYRVLFRTLKDRIKIVTTAKMKSSSYKENDGNAAASWVNELNTDLTSIASKGRHLSFVLARSDPGYDILMTSAGKTARKLIKNGKIDIHMIEDADHTFSKYKPRCDAVNAIVQHLITRYKP